MSWCSNNCQKVLQVTASAGHTWSGCRPTTTEQLLSSFPRGPSHSAGPNSQHRCCGSFPRASGDARWDDPRPFSSWSFSDDDTAAESILPPILKPSNMSTGENNPPPSWIISVTPAGPVEGMDACAKAPPKCESNDDDDVDVVGAVLIEGLPDLASARRAASWRC